MPINSACTGCGQYLSVADQHVGKQARCPSCGQIYTVPLRSTIDEAGNPISAPQTSADSRQNQFDFGASGSQAEVVPTASIVDDPQVATNSSDQFWMRAFNGQVYGPVDRNNLDRWFREGRVGVDYHIRQGEAGDWKQAAAFQPLPTPPVGYAQSSSFAATIPYPSNNSTQSNPYAAQSNPYTATPNPYVAQPGPTTVSPNQMRSEKGALVLIFGVLSWVLCFGFGIAAVVVGNQAKRDIDAGIGNPNERTLINIGFWLGLISVILNVIGLGAFLFFTALSSVVGR
ncbi:MAG: DUF4190 domain-containing protein [Pirellulales bacterium]